MKLSIIIPIYNCEKYLERCLNSILNQTYKNLEVILINDASIDRSLTICEKYQEKDNRIKIINKTENTGVSDTRNVGIENATGDYITFIDSDDYIDLNAYEECMKLIDENKVDMLRFGCMREFGSLKRFGTFKTVTDKVIVKENFDTEIFPNVFGSGDYIVVWSLIVKREVIKDLKFDVNIKFSEDFLFSVKAMLNANSLYFINKPFYHYVANPNSATQKYDFQKISVRIENVLIAYTEILNLIEKSPNIIEQYCKKINMQLINAKIGLVAYYDTYANYKKIINEIKLLDSYKNFIAIVGNKYEIKSSWFNFLLLKLKTGIKEVVKGIGRKKI